MHLMQRHLVVLITRVHGLPSLPTLMAEGGGTWVITMPVLRSLTQARSKWSDNAAGAIWDTSIVKVILGGASNSRDLHDLSTLIGDSDEATEARTVGDRGSRSSQRSIRRVAINAAQSHPHTAVWHRGRDVPHSMPGSDSVRTPVRFAIGEQELRCWVRSSDRQTTRTWVRTHRC